MKLLHIILDAYKDNLILNEGKNPYQDSWIFMNPKSIDNLKKELGFRSMLEEYEGYRILGMDIKTTDDEIDNPYYFLIVNFNLTN